MSYIVTKSYPVLVPPAASTPSGTLSLSTLDHTLNFFIEFISVFSHGKQPEARIKDAFAKALIHYYPVAGRISRMKDACHEHLVDCTGEGIWYVEATANCSLTDVNYFELPLMIPKDELLPKPPAGVKLEEQIIVAQITKFTCGGFSVGILFTHMFFDGQGAAQFLKAVGEMARGLLEPTVKPVWSREALPFPLEVLHGEHTPSFTSLNLVDSVVDISLDSINRVKNLFFIETGQKCSTFDVATAMILKSRTKAINLASNDEVSLMFAASTRHLLYDILPSMKGYYGNCVYSIIITKTSKEINDASLAAVINLIKQAKEAISSEFNDWINNKLYRQLPKGPNYGKLAVADWRNVGFNEVDYGWGEPKYVFSHFNDFNILGLGTYLKPPVPKQGIRLMLRCVEKDHATKFLDELQKF